MFFLEINLTRTSWSAIGISLSPCLPRYDSPYDDGASPGQYSQHTEDMAFTTHAPPYQFLLVLHFFTPPCCNWSTKARSVEIDRLDSQFEWSSPAIPTDTAGANEPVCPSLLPAMIELEGAGEALSPTDDIYPRINSRSSRPLRESTAVPLSKTSNMTAKRYPDAHPRLVSVLRHGSLGPDSAPLRSPVQAVPTSDTRIKRHVHYTVPPGSDEQPGPEVVIVHDSLLIAPMVAADVRQYQKSVPR